MTSRLLFVNRMSRVASSSLNSMIRAISSPKASSAVSIRSASGSNPPASCPILVPTSPVLGPIRQAPRAILPRPLTFATTILKEGKPL